MHTDDFIRQNTDSGENISDEHSVVKARLISLKLTCLIIPCAALSLTPVGTYLL